MHGTENKPKLQRKILEPALGCLYDVIDDREPDASMRPNQIFAVSLDFSMLDQEKSAKVVDVVHQELADAIWPADFIF